MNIKLEYKSKIRQSVKQFDVLEERERLLISVTVLGLLVISWFTFGVEPVLNKIEKTDKDIVSLHSEVNENLKRIKIIVNELANHPDNKLENDVARLEKSLVGMDAEIRELSSNYVPASKMTVLLRKLFSDSEGLVLKSLKNLPSESVSQNANQETLGADSFILGLYRHGMEMELEGDFYQIRTFLLKAKELQWNLHWQEIDYEVVEYPYANVKLRVFTFSTDKAWIGGWGDE